MTAWSGAKIGQAATASATAVVLEIFRCNALKKSSEFAMDETSQQTMIFLRPSAKYQSIQSAKDLFLEINFFKQLCCLFFGTPFLEMQICVEIPCLNQCFQNFIELEDHFVGDTLF